MKGTFEDGVGTFYGEEMHQGNRVKLMFLWRQISADQLYWEQAYFDEKNDAWETNWTMTFTRAATPDNTEDL